MARQTQACWMGALYCLLRLPLIMLALGVPLIPTLSKSEVDPFECDQGAPGIQAHSEESLRRSPRGSESSRFAAETLSESRPR